MDTSPRNRASASETDTLDPPVSIFLRDGHPVDARPTTADAATLDAAAKELDKGDATPEVHGQPRPLTAEDVLSVRYVTGPMVSPNGSHVAYGIVEPPDVSDPLGFRLLKVVYP